MLTDNWCSLQKWFYVSVCVVVVKIFLFWCGPFLMLGFSVTRHVGFQLPDQGWNSHTLHWRVESHHWTTRDISVWFFLFDPRMTAWGEQIRDSLHCAWGGKGLGGSSDWPRSTTWVVGREENKAPRATVPVLWAGRVLTHGFGFLLFQLRLPKWATRPEFPKNDCIFNIGKRLSLRRSLITSLRYFNF